MTPPSVLRNTPDESDAANHTPGSVGDGSSMVMNPPPSVRAGSQP